MARDVVGLRVSYDLPMRSVSGQIGVGVSPGTDRRATWNAGNDWNGNFSSKCRVRIWAFDNSTPVPPMGMVYIPPGTFRMGWESASVIGGDVTLTITGVWMSSGDATDTDYRTLSWFLCGDYGGSA